MLRKGLTLSLVTAALLFAASTAAQADDRRSFRAGPLRVVTQNLYVGGDILLPLSVPPEQFPAAAAEVVGQIIATNYPERAIKVSDLILHEWPHLIGLQEVYIVKICLDETQLACLLDQDYLDILLDNLNAGFDWYREVATVTNIDIQNLPASLPDGTPVFVSITDRDVTLAHRWVRTDNVVAAHYGTLLPFESPFLPPGFAIARGYTMVDAGVLGREYRFVNTHVEVTGAGSEFEPFFRSVQTGQMLELLGLLQFEDLTQIVVGDFNSDPFDGPFVACMLPNDMGGFDPGFCPTPYAMMAGVNPYGIAYTDVWLERRGPFDPGNTCCQATLLDNVFSELDKRIDLIWAKQASDYVGPPFLRSVRAKVIGEEPGDKTFPSGLWPSDHGGVSAKMVLFTPK